MKNLKNIKIPHGVTLFGIGATANALNLAHKKNTELQNSQSELKQELNDIKSELQDLKNTNNTVIEQNNNVLEQNNNLLDKVNDISDKLDKVIGNSSNSNNLLNNPLSYFEDLKTFINQYIDYFSSFDLNQQLHIYNIV